MRIRSKVYLDSRIGDLEDQIFCCNKLKYLMEKHHTVFSFNDGKIIFTSIDMLPVSIHMLRPEDCSISGYSYWSNCPYCGEKIE